MTLRLNLPKTTFNPVCKQRLSPTHSTTRKTLYARKNSVYDVLYLYLVAEDTKSRAQIYTVSPRTGRARLSNFMFLNYIFHRIANLSSWRTLRMDTTGYFSSHFHLPAFDLSTRSVSSQDCSAALPSVGRKIQSRIHVCF